MRFETRRFKLVPLTPVHIGTGDTIPPDEYAIDQGKLIHFRLPAVLRDLNAGERSRFDDLLAKGKLRELTEMLWQKGRDPRYRVYASRLGRTASRELTSILSDMAENGSKGEVRLLPRNPYTGEIVIPGSSIKGAIRTALLSVRLNGSRELFRAAEQCKRDDAKRAAVRLEEIGFQFTRNKTELDPLRGLSVSDSVLGADAARVDRATVVRLAGGEDVAGIRMYYERLPAVADCVRPAVFEVEIGVDTALARRRGEGTPKVEWSSLIQHCNEFYRRRWEAERNRFGNIHADINLAALPPGAIFLRIGRFSHFESLSVDELREGWNVQARRPMKEGSTRTLCELAVKGKKAAFGWVLLEPLG